MDKPQAKLSCDTEVGDYIDSMSVASAMAHDKATFEEVGGRRICRVAADYCANGPNVGVEMVFKYHPELKMYRRIA